MQFFESDCMCACMFSHSVASDSLQPLGQYPTSLLCSWNFLGKNIGVGCHFLLQGIFPTQRSNLLLFCVLHWQMDSLTPHHLGSPRKWLCPLCEVTSVTSNSLWRHEPEPTSLVCPWDSPGKSSTVGFHFILQAIFPTQGSNPSLLLFLHWQVGS